MKLVLLDRDGVINDDPGYVKSPEDLIIFPHALEALALFHRKGFTVAVVTNQSIVGRGMITQAKLDEIHHAMQARVQAAGGEIAEVYFCPEHPDGASDRRKPGSGMIREALARFNAQAEDTPMVGDNITDLEAAYGAGCPRHLVLTGRGAQSAKKIPTHLQPVALHAHLLDAAIAITGG